MHALQAALLRVDCSGTDERQDEATGSGCMVGVGASKGKLSNLAPPRTCQMWGAGKEGASKGAQGERQGW